ncbi:MAG: fibronectin type III domain-containing protein [Butyrivibrio sp.]|jgi:hypothetical protein|nr:fibronectin type III domain-containing protein [Butyrivibrio sp.]
MKKLMRYFALSLMLCFIFLPATRVKAAGGALWATEHTSNSVSVQWTRGDENQTLQTDINNQKYRQGSVIKYEIGIGSDDATSKTNVTADVTDSSNYTFSGLTAGTKYFISLKYYVYEPEVIDKDNPQNNKPAVTTNTRTTLGTIPVITTPSVPSNVHATFWSLTQDKLRLEWDQAGNYTGFEVQYTDSDGEKHKKTTTEKKIELYTEYTTYFKVTVKAYVDIDGKREYSDWSDEAFTFAQPLINETEDGFDISIKNGKMKISWEKIGQATGYEIYVGTKKNGPYKMVKKIQNKGTTKASFKFNGKKFNKNKEYYVYVVAYRTKNGKTSKSTANQVFNYRKGDTYMTLRNKS